MKKEQKRDRCQEKLGQSLNHPLRRGAEETKKEKKQRVFQHRKDENQISSPQKKI